VTKLECCLKIPDSCKLVSKKRDRKTIEQKKQQKEDEDEIKSDPDYVNDDKDDAESEFQAQSEHPSNDCKGEDNDFRNKTFTQSRFNNPSNNQQKTKKILRENQQKPPVSKEENNYDAEKNNNAPDENPEHRPAIKYTPKKMKAITTDQQSDNKRLEISNFLLSKPEKATKSIDLLYTNKLLELKKRIWSEDITRDELEELIRDFESFRRSYLPEILSKQSKERLRETDARISYLIQKWDIDINPILTLKN